MAAEKTKLTPYDKAIQLHRKASMGNTPSMIAAYNALKSVPKESEKYKDAMLRMKNLNNRLAMVGAEGFKFKKIEGAAKRKKEYLKQGLKEGMSDIEKSLTKK